MSFEDFTQNVAGEQKLSVYNSIYGKPGDYCDRVKKICARADTRASQIIVWLDIETTGLSPTQCHILELAMVLTDIEGNELRLNSVESKFNSIVMPCNISTAHLGPKEYTRLGNIYEIDSLFSKLFATNGLFKDHLDNSGNWLLLCYPKVQENACKWLANVKAELGLADQFFIAGGTNVDFDLSFLAAKMPLLRKFFHFTKLDLATLRIASNQRPQIYPPAELQHRALYDLYHNINEYKSYKITVNNTPVVFY